ncbi:acyl-CoA thioesterase-1 [Cognatiyoonia koreensis]|uniref:Acyl-CoA thioesterase-1 n=1 Tax=Cognatiyoonia koreensis TaxID=364200 RepID=A0A1I0MUQ2_9RHOB|nr:arylesterase [Cognatiyoonia koreensis]SEV92056.1 acyl-CoA thioesterase-1 [Cognatiyoonia koreensis]
MKRAFARFVAFGYGAFINIRNLTMMIVLSAGVVQAETVTIAALGDSLTAGYGLDTADGFVPQMQAWLDAQGADVKLVNAGVSGDTTAGGLLRTDWTLTEDVDAMIVALGGNDYLRGIDPAVSRANLAAILDKAQSRDVDVLLVGLVAGANYGADYKEEFDSMYPDLAETYDVPLYSRWFAGLLAVSGMEDGFAEFLQRDGLHPNAEGVRLIVEAMGPSVLQLAQQAGR